MGRAETIFEQLGGRQFIAMTGAKNFVADGDVLRFKLPKCKKGINYVAITLMPDDTYTVCFNKIVKQTEVTEISKREFVYEDNLQEIFTLETGLYTRL